MTYGSLRAGRRPGGAGRRAPCRAAPTGCRSGGSGRGSRRPAAGRPVSSSSAVAGERPRADRDRRGRVRDEVRGPGGLARRGDARVDRPATRRTRPSPGAEPPVRRAAQLEAGVAPVADEVVVHGSGPVAASALRRRSADPRRRSAGDRPVGLGQRPRCQDLPSVATDGA